MKRKTIRFKKRRKTRKQKGGNGLDVFYNNIKVAGQELPKDITQVRPTVKFPTTGKLYTLVMWDPDVPPQIQPGFIHWLITNILSPNDIYKNEVLEYKGPAPPSGIHRYYFGLFEQDGHINLKQPERQNFSINEFIKNNNLRKVTDIFMKVSFRKIR
jgi:phosphatidylethanolamine-binding protein (PEBP) family uncharacterized protein